MYDTVGSRTASTYGTCTLQTGALCLGATCGMLNEFLAYSGHDSIPQGVHEAQVCRPSQDVSADPGVLSKLNKSVEFGEKDKRLSPLSPVHRRN